MIALIVLAVVVVAASIVEVAFPGRAIYHFGWFNVSIAALVIVALAATRNQFVKTQAPLGRGGIVALGFGVAIAGLATVASGLLAPDARTVVGAPGERVRVDDLGGTLDFPLAAAENAESNAAPSVVLDRPGHAPLEIGARARNAGSFVLRTLPRDVAYVEARDARGGRLTITQPSGSAFLSPVLLMQQRQTIASLNLPFDSFAVPAAHRIVKAVLFTPQEASMMRGMEGAAVPAVLFAVDDDNDRPLRNAIVLAPDGQTIHAGGVALRAVVRSYPAVEIVAAPAIVAVALGALLVLAGIAAKGKVYAGRS